MENLLNDAMRAMYCSSAQCILKITMYQSLLSAIVSAFFRPFKDLIASRIASVLLASVTYIWHWDSIVTKVYL